QHCPGAGLPLCPFSPSDSEQHSARRQTPSALNARDSARGRRPVGQICATPPSTKSSAPLMKLASSDARKATAFATSAASPRRPIGTTLARCCKSFPLSELLIQADRELHRARQPTSPRRRHRPFPTSLGERLKNSCDMC